MIAVASYTVAAGAILRGGCEKSRARWLTGRLAARGTQLRRRRN